MCCHLVTERKHEVRGPNCMFHLGSCEMELSWCSPWIHCGRRIHSHWEQMSRELWFFSSGWTAAQAGSLMEREEDTYHHHYKKTLPSWFYSYQRCEVESKSSDLNETRKVKTCDLTWPETWWLKWPSCVHYFVFSLNIRQITHIKNVQHCQSSHFKLNKTFIKYTSC